MVAIIDFKAEFGKLKLLEGRTPTTSEAEREGAFAKLAPYRDGAIFAGKFSGRPGNGIRWATRLCKSSMGRRRCI